MENRYNVTYNVGNGQIVEEDISEEEKEELVEYVENMHGSISISKIKG